MDSKVPEYQPVSTELQTEPPDPAIVVPDTQAQTQTLITAEPRYAARPPNFMPLSVFALFCCCCWPAIMFAVVSMIYSAQVDLAWEIGHRERAKRASQWSMKLGTVAILSGILMLSLIIGLNVLYFTGNLYIGSAVF